MVASSDAPRSGCGSAVVRANGDGGPLRLPRSVGPTVGQVLRHELLLLLRSSDVARPFRFVMRVQERAAVRRRAIEARPEAGSNSAVKATPVRWPGAPVRTPVAPAIALYDLPSCSRASRFVLRESVGPPWKADIPPVIIHIIATIIRMQNRATTEITSFPWRRS
jgi:hypothetical protein